MIKDDDLKAKEDIVSAMVVETIANALTSKTVPKIRRGKKPNGMIEGEIPGLKRTGGRTLTPLALVNHLNRNMVKSIRANMGSPRLNWRTGRLANSVRVLGIDSTRKDMITVVYSYMKYPYDFFEPGRSRLATPMRDPRKLIAMSIRDIAIRITQEKFTTKRVFS